MEGEKKGNFSYQPKKQPFVYVYSIRRKLAKGLDQVVPEVVNDFKADEKGSYAIEGNPAQQSMAIRTKSDHSHHVLRAVKFLQQRKISHSPVSISQNFGKETQSLAINVIPSEELQQLVVLKKSNIMVDIRLQEGQNIEEAISKVKKSLSGLKTQFGLHPCPKTYALFHVLKNRKLGASVNDLLDKYWFPTYKICQAFPNELKVLISLPPLKKDFICKVLKAFKEDLAPFAAKLEELRHGCLSYFDLELLNIIHMACLSNTARPLDLVVADFWESG